jgi:hypothetical protein
MGTCLDPQPAQEEGGSVSTRPIHVTLDDDVYEALLAYAKAQDRSPANVLRHALRGYLSRNHALGPSDAMRVRATASQGGPAAGDTPSKSASAADASTSVDTRVMAGERST